jgi:radical SAM superfamily enzyme YgiQ (UPF0313 family)
MSQRLAANPKMRELTALIVYAFDLRTRLLPFLFADSRMIPAGVRAVADALHGAGLTKLRVVFQLWTPNVRPAHAWIDGCVPDLLLISGLHLHSQKMYELVADAHRIPESRRPLILCGGPKAIYEPWDFFGLGEDGRINTDISVTGECYVLLELLERLLEYKGAGETMRQAFLRARDADALYGIPGLMYRIDPPGGREAHLIDTGIQRLMQYLDELPMPLASFGKIEPPHRARTLAARPIPVDQIHKHCRITSLIITHGCKFRCSFCPIPAYNQNSFRFKSPERLGDEMQLLRTDLGLRIFFGTDDSFLNHRPTFEAMYDHLASRRILGRKFGRMVAWGTEATLYDAHKHLDTFRQARRAGLRALWFGIEDLTGTVVKKGQDGDKTREVFARLIKLRIMPMPMMIHHDGQPLYSRDNLYGLLNQVRYLRKAGAISMQISVLTPNPGTEFYEKPFEDGLVFESVGGRRVEEAQWDGIHVIASRLPNPWRQQLNLIAGYAVFYNPWNLLKAFLRRNFRVAAADLTMQLIGMAALAKTTVECARWTWKLLRGPIKRFEGVPQASKLPIVKVRPHEIETKRPTAIPPDSSEVYGIKPPSREQIALPILAAS